MMGLLLFVLILFVIGGVIQYVVESLRGQAPSPWRATLIGRYPHNAVLAVHLALAWVGVYFGFAPSAIGLGLLVSVVTFFGGEISRDGAKRRAS